MRFGHVDTKKAYGCEEVLSPRRLYWNLVGSGGKQKRSMDENVDWMDIQIAIL
jgi:hypothetical protein